MKQAIVTAFPNMTRLSVTFLFAFATLAAVAQTETKGTVLSGTATGVRSSDFSKSIVVDSLHFLQEIPTTEFLKPDVPQSPPMYDLTMVFTLPSMPTNEPFSFWHGANIAVYGVKEQMPGLMDAATGMVTLHQDFGPLHLSASAIANKYWMPMHGNLTTQYGIGGTLGYDINDAITLHAFGYYYAGNPLVGPAYSPYISTTSFGGYADIRISDRFGSNVGVRRYINPMSGRWTTEPIVNPYIRIGKGSKIEIPLGGLLKAAIWGDRDNPMRFQPRPVPTNQPKRNSLK